jgi:bifunctional non-homologous end joining protein LigD
MHGRRDERQEPWLWIKERDDDARAVSEYSVVDELPDSVNSGTQHAAGFLPKASSKAEKPVKAEKRAAAADAVVAKDRKPASSRRQKQSAPNEGRVDLPAGAVPAELPLALAPQLATLVDRPPPGDDWVYEIKFDGYRLLTRIDGDDIRLFTRNGNDWTSKLKGLAAAIKAMELPSCEIAGAGARREAS